MPFAPLGESRQSTGSVESTGTGEHRGDVYPVAVSRVVVSAALGRDLGPELANPVASRFGAIKIFVGQTPTGVVHRTKS
jgi:hypothetical protein